MRKPFYAFLFLAVLIAFLLIPDDANLGIPILLEENESKQVELNSSSLYDIREYYHELLKGIDMKVKRMEIEGYDISQRAESCNVMRSSARKIARSKNSSLRNTIVSFALQLRDSFSYGLAYLPAAVLHDFLETIDTHTISATYTTMTIKQFRSCLLLSQERNCPTYQFMRTVMGKDDEDILLSCTKSNKGYDKLTRKIEEAKNPQNNIDLRKE